MKNILNLTLVLCFSLLTAVHAESKFSMQDIKSFKTMEQFKSPEIFDKYINEYIQECLDNGYGGAGSLSCLVNYDLWDRELNIYYKRLYHKLDKQGKEILKASQKEWLRSRDLSKKMTSFVMSKINDGNGGTAQILIGAMFANNTLSPIIKSRAILLKNWCELLDTDTKVHE